MICLSCFYFIIYIVNLTGKQPRTYRHAVLFSKEYYIVVLFTILLLVCSNAMPGGVVWLPYSIYTRIVHCVFFRRAFC